MRKLFLFIVCFILFGVGIKAQRFPQAVLPGDYPDPSILRDGKDYYMTHSPFYYAFHGFDALGTGLPGVTRI